MACCYAVQTNNYTVQELRKLYGSGDPRLWPKPFLFDEAKDGFQDIGPLPAMIFPDNNPYSLEKSELGQILFFDPQLSESGNISCASCHKPNLTFADNKIFSLGHHDQEGLRNVPTILNSGFAKKLFWDGRSNSLEEQVKHPIENPLEMNFQMDFALGRIKNSEKYKTLFRKAFGSSEITEDKLAKAIATFERTLVSPKSRFDLFVEGKMDEFSDDELMGLHLFRTKANCISCHNTPYFSDSKFHNIGLDFFSRNDNDLGRFDETKKPEDRKKFKTPTLREVSQTSPYMHNGQFSELMNIMNMYNAGMGTENLTAEQLQNPHFPKKSKMIKKLELSDEEMIDIIAFLKTLKAYQNIEN